MKLADMRPGDLVGFYKYSPTVNVILFKDEPIKTPVGMWQFVNYTNHNKCSLSSLYMILQITECSDSIWRVLLFGDGCHWVDAPRHI